MKKQIPMMGLGFKSGLATVTAQERVNCYLEVRNDTEKERTVCLGTYGFTLFSDALGDTPIRGWYAFNDYLYLIHRGAFWSVNNAGIFKSLGTISSTEGRVSLGCNSSQILVVDGSTSGYVYNIADDKIVTISNASPAVVSWTANGLPEGAAVRFSTTFALPDPLVAGTTYYVKNAGTNSFNLAATRGGASINTTTAGSGVHTGSAVIAAITDAGFAGGVSCDYLDGRLIINKPDSQRYYISGIRDALTWDALDYSSAESSPDILKRVFVDHSQILLLGQFTTENHADTGAQDFPFSRVGTAIDWGIVSAWSIARLDNSVAYLAQKRMGGQASVVLYTGGTPQRISTDDIDRIINTLSNLESATAFSYYTNSHPMYVLNVGGYTFMYDFSSKCWSYLRSYGINRYRGELSENFIGRTLVSDYENGNIYQISSTTYDENGSPLVMKLSGKHIFNNMDRLTLNEINIDIENGVGTESGQGVNPVMVVELSKDGGRSPGIKRFVPMGARGETKQLLRVGQFGQCRDAVLTLTISDPVLRCINGVYADVEADSD